MVPVGRVISDRGCGRAVPVVWGALSSHEGVEFQSGILRAFPETSDSINQQCPNFLRAESGRYLPLIWVESIPW